MDHLSTICNDSYIHPSLHYDVRLAYIMNPLGRLPANLLRLSGSTQHTDYKQKDSFSSASPSGKAIYQRHPLLTYNEAYIKSFSISMKLQGHEDCVNSLALNPTEKLLVTASNDQCLCVYDTEDWSFLERYRTMHRSKIFCAVFCPEDTSRVISCGADGRAIITDLRTSQAFFKCRLSSVATQLAVSSWWPDTAFVSYKNGLVGRIDTRMRRYDDMQPSFVGPSCNEVSQVNSISMHDRWPFLLALSTNSSHIFLHDIRMGSAGAIASLVHPVVDNERCNGVSDVSFSNSGDMIAINYMSNNVCLAPWLKSLYSTDMTGEIDEDYMYLSGLRSTKIPSVTLQDTLCLKGRSNKRIMCKKIVFLENDSIVCSGSDCGKVYFWRSFDGALIHSSLGDSVVTNEVLYNKSRGALLSSGIDATTKVLLPDPKTLRDILCDMSPHGRTISPSSFRSDERLTQISVSGENELDERIMFRGRVRQISESLWSGESFMFSDHENSVDDEDSDSLDTISEYRGNFPTESISRVERNIIQISRMRSISALRSVEDTRADLQFMLIAKMNDEISLRGILSLEETLKQLKNIFGRFCNLSMNASPVVPQSISVDGFEEEKDFLNYFRHHYRYSVDNGDLFNIIEEDGGADIQRGDIGNSSVASYNGVMSYFSAVLAEGDDSGKVEHCESVSSDFNVTGGISSQPEMYKSKSSILDGYTRMVHRFSSTSFEERYSPYRGEFTFLKLCVAIDVLKRHVDSAFRQWLIPFPRACDAPLRPQVARWDRCILNPHLHSDTRIDGGRDRFQTAPLTADTVFHSAHSAQYNEGEKRVQSLLTMMELLLEENMIVCRRRDELRRYWEFRCVVDTGFIYFFMAVGDTEAALERVGRLERFVEYRSITALGSATDLPNNFKQKRAGHDEEKKCSALCLLSLCDSASFYPLLVPLAIRIRILHLCLKEGVFLTGYVKRDAMEIHVTNLVIELRRRMNGHPNLKICRRISDMLKDLAL